MTSRQRIFKATPNKRQIVVRQKRSAVSIQEKQAQTQTQRSTDIGNALDRVDTGDTDADTALTMSIQVIQTYPRSRVLSSFMCAGRPADGADQMISLPPAQPVCYGT